MGLTTKVGVAEEGSSGSRSNSIALDKLKNSVGGASSDLSNNIPRKSIASSAARRELAREGNARPTLDNSLVLCRRIDFQCSS